MSADAEQFGRVSNECCDSVAVCVTGKAMVYTAAAGLQPHHVLPVQVDVGCNTAEVRDHPLYMGLQQVGG